MAGTLELSFQYKWVVLYSTAKQAAGCRCRFLEYVFDSLKFILREKQMIKRRVPGSTSSPLLNNDNIIGNPFLTIRLKLGDSQTAYPRVTVTGNEWK